MQGPLTKARPLHEKILNDAASGCSRAWDGVQRAWRDTPLMRTVVGYQRLTELPPAPWPIQWLSWFKMASTLSDDTAPSASLDHLEAQAAPPHPGAPPGPLGG